ncbi:MAG: hypothetical protein AB7D57_06900, partial [Desulfovibrionaceae bacterium]
MRKKKKIDSTEELLDIIRDDASAVSSSAPTAEAQEPPPIRPGKVRPPKERPAPAKKKRLLPEKRHRPRAKRPLWGGNRKTTVAIDLRPDSLVVVRMARRDRGGQILDMERIPLPGSPPSQDAQVEALRALGKRLGRRDKVWSVLRTGDMDINLVRIPKVPAKRVSDTVYWQLQKERKFDDAEYVVDFRVIGPVKDNGVSKIEVMACLAKRSEVDQIVETFRKAGVPLTGVTTIPNAFQGVYAAGWCDCGEGLCANVHVDADFSCISILSGAQLQFTRTIKSGTVSMAEELLDAYNTRHGKSQAPAAPAAPAPSPEGDLDGPSLEMAPAPAPAAAPPAPETPPMELCRMQEALEGCLCRLEDRATLPDGSLERAEVVTLVTPALDRISRQVERTLDYHHSRTQQRCDRLHLSGEVFACLEIRNQIAEQLGMEASLFDPVAGSGQTTAQATLATERERLAFAEAVAACLSDEARTINLSQTYKARDRARRRRLLDNAVSLAFLVLVMVAAGAFFWTGQMVKERQARLHVLEAQLAVQPKVDADVLRALAGKMEAAQARLRSNGERYQSQAVLSELSAQTPH